MPVILKGILRALGIWALMSLGLAHADGYWTSGNGEPIRSGNGACVRASYWSPTPPVAGCDPLPVPVPAPPVAEPSRPKPARIVLLPDPSGQPGAVIVRTPSGEQVLNEAYAGLQASSEGITRSTETADSVAARYGDVLAAASPRPVTFVVRFETGSATKLTVESAAVFARLNDALVSWPAPQLMVVGHTDRVGTDESNDALSLKRAQTVAKFLTDRGIAAARIESVGRGKREPLVPTADGVAEAANRRVEITLR